MAHSVNRNIDGASSMSIDTLLRLVPDSPEMVLAQLSEHPALACAADSTGYSLLHAAASYSQVALLRALVNDHHVNVNIIDDEGETPLFAAETLETAQCLVEELGADPGIRNVEDRSAEDNALESMEDGGDWHLVADYLERKRNNNDLVLDKTPDPDPTPANGDIGDAAIVTPTVEIADPASLSSSEVSRPPPLPPNIRVNMGTMQEPPLEGEGAPDPEFRRRIEELAARDDFNGEDAQEELRNLVSDAIGGLSSPEERGTRRRTDQDA